MSNAYTLPFDSTTSNGSFTEDDFPDIHWPVAPEARHFWQHSLERWFDTNPNITVGKVERLLDSAMDLCDWLLAARVFERYPKFKMSRPLCFALVSWKCGRWMQACDFLEQQMLLRPKDKNLYALYNDLLHMSQMQGIPRLEAQELAPDVSLEPLQPHHCDDYLWQSWDTSIAELCCLPDLHSVLNWQRWFEEQQRFTDQTLFAIQHRDWGFIGVVRLVLQQGVGFFYFWLGKDFRNQGLGTQAARLLVHIAEQGLGLNSCFAKAYTHNARSRHVLEKLGFVPLLFPENQAESHECFYYYGAPTTQKIMAQTLATLFDNMQASLGEDVPLRWQLKRADI